MQLSVSHQPRRSIIRPWMMSSLPTLVIIFAVLILILHGGATIASGAVIVAQLDSGTPPPTAPPAPSSSSSQEITTASRFQIVVKDYTEDDNRLAGASSLTINSNSTSNETELSNSTVPLATPNSSTMTTKSPSEWLRINICINNNLVEDVVGWWTILELKSLFFLPKNPKWVSRVIWC